MTGETTMDIYEEFGLKDSMDKAEVLEKISEAIKKLIPRQKVEDINKRNTVLRQMSVLSNSENAIKKAAAGFPNVHLIIKTYALASDVKKLNYDLTSEVNEAVSGGGAAALKVSDFLTDYRQDDLRNQWMFWAAECSEVSAYQACGHILMDSDPDQALEWFDKAAAANAIDADGLYDWGLIYYRKKAYDRALPKLEQASAKGHGEAAYYVAVISGNGHAGAKPTLVYKSERRSDTPNLDSIHIDNLKDGTGSDNTKRPSWKKLAIGVIAILFLTSLFRSCATSLLLKHEAEKNKFDPFETTVLGENIIATDEMAGAGSADMENVANDADSMEEPVEVEEKHRDLTADEKILVGTYDGYYFSGGRKVGMTLTVYEKNGLEASCKVYPLAGDTSMQPGEYLMDAAYSDGRYIFTATDWVEQPGGYNMNDLNGVLEGEMLYGMTNMNNPFSVTITDDDNTVKETWLTDLAYLQADNDIIIVEDRVGTANTGEEYAHHIRGNENGFIEYYLKGEYNHLSAVWAISYNGRNTQANQACEIYADDELVYSSPSITGGDMPLEVNTDIKYCQILRIVFTEGDANGILSNIYLEAAE